MTAPSQETDEEQFLSPFVPPYMTDEQRYRHLFNHMINCNDFVYADREKSANYFQLINSISPNDLISKFANSTPSFVQEGVRTTLANVLGTLPNYAFDTSLLTTSTKLASLLFQMQITGYMFKNAEFRMSFTKSLKGRINS